MILFSAVQWKHFNFDILCVKLLSFCVYVHVIHSRIPKPSKMQILGLVDLSKSKLRFCFNSNLFDLNYSSTHIDIHS